MKEWRSTVPVNPRTDVTVTIEMPVVPELRLRVEGLAVMLMLGGAAGVM